MTVKEASEKFGIDEKEIRKRKKDEMIIGAKTIKHRIVIPDDTKIIPAKQDIICFLYEIIKYKNNPQIIISRRLCPELEDLKIMIEYLYKRGYIGEYNICDEFIEMFSSLNLTEEGLEIVIGSAQINKIKSYSLNPISINPQVRIGLINL